MPEENKINSPILYSSDGEDIEVILNNENVWATRHIQSVSAPHAL